MEVIGSRPKLVSFRATGIHAESKTASSGYEPWNFQLTETIEVVLASAKNDQATALHVVVKIDLLAKATKTSASDEKAEFNAAYEAKFEYPAGVTEAEVLPQLDKEFYQYMLVAQAFPLAMTHFRREMQSMGFDARDLPLGI